MLGSKLASSYMHLHQSGLGRPGCQPSPTSAPGIRPVSQLNMRKALCPQAPTKQRKPAAHTPARLGRIQTAMGCAWAAMGCTWAATGAGADPFSMLGQWVCSIPASGGARPLRPSSSLDSAPAASAVPGKGHARTHLMQLRRDGGSVRARCPRLMRLAHVDAPQAACRAGAA